jgi:amide synthase
VQRRSLGADWSPIYRFKLDYHAITDWQDIVASLADFPLEVSLIGTRIHSRAFDNGQWVLIGKRYLTVADGKEEIRVLAKPEQYQEVVDVILNGAS